MTLKDKLEHLVAQLPPDQRLDFADLLQAVYQVRFTGPLTIDFRNGTPQQISLGQPIKFAICAGEGLDKAPSPSPR